MLTNLYRVLFAIFSLVLLGYLALPVSRFPEPLPGTKQSKELGDTETPLRRAYFTDLNREEAMAHYKKVSSIQFLGLTLAPLRLNYPPEEAKFLIRDQTRSTFLEELAHPLRTSVYVNGFEPKVAKDAINIEGVAYLQKITVRYVPSSLFMRLGVAVLGLGLLYALLPMIKQSITNNLKFIKQ